MTVSTSSSKWQLYRPTTEPILAFLFFALSISSMAQTDLIIKQACKSYGLDVDNCTHNQTNEGTYEEVHRTASTIGLYQIIISTVPGAFALMTTPWSETNGRKPILIVSLAGYTVSQGTLTYMSTMPDINPYYFLISTLPLLITGGLVILAVTSIFYIIDVSPPEQRVIRIAIMTEVGLLGTIAGNLVAPLISEFGYAAVFGTNALLAFTCILYVILLVPESIDVKNENKVSLFTVAHIVDSFTCFCKKRPNGVRGIIIGLTIFSCMAVAIVSGEPDVKYLTVKKQFNWSLADYSMYNAVCQGVQAVFTLGGVYVGVTLLKIDEVTLIVAMQITVAAGSIIMASVPTPTAFYITSQTRCFAGCLMPIIKAYLAQIVPSDEIAKVLAFGNTFEAFMPQLSSLVYSKVYNQVVGTDPFSVYYLSAGIALAQVFCAIFVWFFSRRANRNESQSSKENPGNPENPANGNPSVDQSCSQQPVA